MFLIRLLLRLVLLLFLFISVTVAWNEKDWVTRLVMIVVSVLLVVGIYFLRYLRSMEKSKYATGSDPSMAWQLMWSEKTPFFPKASQEPLVFEDSGLSPFFPLMSPGFHIVCAKLVPMAVSLVSVWIISQVVVPIWDVPAYLIQQIPILEQSKLPLLPVVGIVSFLILYLLLQRLFMKRVAARCMTVGCNGHAFLTAEAAGDSTWRRRQYQYVYICREHNHRHPTGVLA